MAAVLSVNGNTYSVDMTGSASLSITDFGSLRGRVGYVFNNFLPYGFAGLALGRGSYNVTADASGQQSTGSVPCTPTPGTCVDYDLGGTSSKSNTLLYGFAVGGGFDLAVTQNIFLRGEYEFIQFAPVAKYHRHDLQRPRRRRFQVLRSRFCASATGPRGRPPRNPVIVIYSRDA